MVGKIHRKDRFDNENMWKKNLFPVDVPFYQFWDWFMVFGFDSYSIVGSVLFETREASHETNTFPEFEA